MLEVLKKYNITPNPDADQHFMVDKKTLERVVSAAEIKPYDTVLEIGAGIGNLTRLLAKKAKKVYAIEKDAALFDALKDEALEFSNVEIIIDDALKAELPKFDKLVANLPYQICEALLQKLTGMDFESAVVCAPETFAKIVCAEKGEKDFSKLSIIAQAFFDAEILRRIPAESFYPKPRTNSALLKFAPKRHLEFHDYFFQELLRQHDKKLKNALREAMIFASKQSWREFGTKRAARELIERLDFPQNMHDRKVAGLSVRELKIIDKKANL